MRHLALLLAVLAACGGRSTTYQASMIHAKTIVVDDTLSVIGSINDDPLSLNKLEAGPALP